MRGRKPIDITGMRFGRLIALEDIGQAPKARGRLWICACDCGQLNAVPAGWLRNGNTQSCGCGQKEAAARNCVARSTHGLSGHRIMTIHRGMIARCDDAESVSYPYYGARGIKICREWYELEIFATWAFSNGYSDNLTIDRIDNNGNYQPDNCQWSTYQEQARNRSGNTLVEYLGETKTVAEWSGISGIGTTTILYRLKAGWDVETTLTRERNHGMRYLG